MQQSGVIGTRRSDALVFFGATGDLAYKKIFPALQALIRAGELRHADHRHGPRRLDAGQAARARARQPRAQRRRRRRTRSRKLSARLQLRRRRLPAIRRPTSACGRRSAARRGRCTTSPFRRACSRPWSQGLAAVGLRRRTRASSSRSRSAATSPRRRRSTATLHAVFPESAIFRIDHYLGKEAVQNLLYFRFANAFLEPIWNRNYVDSVQITMAENFGVAGPRQLLRGGRRDPRRGAEPSAAGDRAAGDGCAGRPRSGRDARREAAPVPRDAAARSGARRARPVPRLPRRARRRRRFARRDLRRAAPAHRHLALGRRAVLHPHRQVPADHRDRGHRRPEAAAAGDLRRDRRRRSRTTSASG